MSDRIGQENEVDANEGDSEPCEDEVPGDDTIIGRAFRWSLAVIGVIALAVAAILFLRPSPQSAEAVREIDAPRTPKLAADASEMPSVSFADITQRAGIGFVHNNGAVGEKMLPETMGGGVAFFDYDGDDDPDLLLVDSTEWSWSRRSGRRSGMKLYRNDGDGRFADVTASSGLGDDFYGMGVAVGDYDSDGDPDVFISAVGSNRFYQNAGGRFRDVTSQAGLAGDDHEWSSSSGFFDYDNDGDLDLFVCNYIRWSREIDLELNFTMNGTNRAYGPPTSFTGTYSYLYRNQGDGTFADVSREAGIQIDNPATGNPMGKALALLPIDLDRDGWIDVIVANDTVQNQVFHNLGGGRFEEIGAEAGMAYDFNGKATGAMGIDAAHLRNDDALGVGIGNFANEMSSLFVSQGDPLWFADESMGEGIGSPSRLKLSFGLFFFDYDLDGRMDLLQANGHIEEEIEAVQAGQTYRQPAQLFWNTGNSDVCFAEVPDRMLGDLAKPLVGRGAAYADIDGDGDQDLILTQTGAAPLLLRNGENLGHHWLRVRLRDSSANPEAIGAWVELKAGGVTQRRQVMPTRSYLSQVELPVTFGLGRMASVEALHVTWPDGAVEQVAVEGVDRTILVTRSADQ